MDLQTYRSLDATDLSELIRKKEMSPSEIFQLAWKQLENINPSLNAVVHHRREQALEEAKNITGEEGVFAGVPFLLKNASQAVKGEKLTVGSRLLASHSAKQDSHLVRKLRANGIVAAGHTNIPEFGLKNITEPELYGPTRNPWNTGHSPGGSSGGSAAAVAGGIVPAAGASDGGGSIRIPASFTGLFGLKPTRGRMPVGPGSGRQWQGAAIDFVLSRSVRDSAALFDLLQTVQPEAAFQAPLLETPVLQEKESDWAKPLTVAFSTQSPVHTPVSDEAVEAVKKTAAWLEKEGHRVEEASPELDGVKLMENYYLMNSGELAGVVSTLEKMSGRKITSYDLELESWMLSEAGKRVSAAEFSLSLQAWDAAAAVTASFHKRYDLYVTPATAYPAPKIGELTQSPANAKEFRRKLAEASSSGQQALIYEMFLPSLTYTPYTQLANLTGQPAVSLPLHLTGEGLPLGVQVMAPKGREDLLFRLAFQLEQSELWKGMKGNPLFEGRER
ncbi:amidase [Salipaludibacillus sp. CUR1]|uniref:amidase family protein n=1 Tax=Salipaludibacillus sp. CUR1 TaxID=2820003 RepID=UPI001E507DF3|nr:amidase [Salipaludibacillus sp. CUR1]